MRKQYIFIPALALIAAACTGSTGAPTSSSSTTSLVITTTSTSPPTTSVVAPPATATSIKIWVPASLVPQMTDTVAAFELDTRIGVEVVAVETDTVLEMLLRDPATGPDVFIGPHTWLTTLTEMGVAEPLPAGSDVVAGALDAVTLRGTVFGAPLALDTVVQFRDILSIVDAPETVESLTSGCPKDGGVVPCLLLATDSVDGHYPFIAAAGGYIFGSDEFDGWEANDVGVDGAEALAGGLILTNLVEGVGILGGGSSTVEDRFVAGNAPLLWGDSSTLAALNLAGTGFAVEQLPTIAEATAPTPIRVTAAWVNAFSPGKEAAIKFVTEYLASPPSADAIALALRLAPVSTSFDADPQLVPFIESARTGDPVPTIFEADYAWEQLAVAFADIRDGADAEQALGIAAQLIRNPPEPEVPVEGEVDG